MSSAHQPSVVGVVGRVRNPPLTAAAEETIRRYYAERFNTDEHHHALAVNRLLAEIHRLRQLVPPE